MIKSFLQYLPALSGLSLSYALIFQSFNMLLLAVFFIGLMAAKSYKP